MTAIQAWAAMKEYAVFKLRETEDNRFRISHSAIRKKIDVSDEAITKFPEIASTDYEINCENDGTDLIFWRRI